MSGDRVSEIGGGVVGAPWFVQFWPLFILFLMVVSVAASLATVVIAYRHADEDVRATEAIHERVR